MSWVGVRYRTIALPDIMKTMQAWLDQRQFQPKAFDYAISGSGMLVRLEFTQGSEAAELLTSTQVVEFWVDPQCRLRWS
jgi:hypothetical protein